MCYDGKALAVATAVSGWLTRERPTSRTRIGHKTPMARRAAATFIAAER